MSLLTSFYEFVNQLAHGLQQSDPLVVTVVFAILIIAASFIVAVNVPIREARILFVLLLAGVTFFLSRGMDNLNNSFFFNLSTEFVGAAVGLLLFADTLFDEIGSWVLLLVVTALVLAGPFLIQELDLDLFTDEFILNLRTDLLGAFVVTILLKRGWIIYNEMKKESHESQRLKDLEQLLRSQKEANQKRREVLLQLQRILKQQEKTLTQYEQILHQQGYSQPVITEYQTGTVDKSRAMLVIEGHTLEHVERTIYQIFEVCDKTVHHPPAEDVMGRLSFLIEVPQSNFAQRLQEQFEELIYTWSQQSKQCQLKGDFSEPGDAQNTDYFYGVASGYQMAMDDLQTLIARLDES